MVLLEHLSQPQIKAYWYSALQSALRPWQPDDKPTETPYILIMDAHAGDAELSAFKHFPCLQSDHNCLLMVVSPMPNAAQGLSAVRLGAHGYMHAYAHPQRIQQALEAIENGQVWLSHEVIQAMSQQLASTVQSDAWKARLTQREVDIVEALMQGMSNREIAQALHISEPTVKTHLKHIFEKFQVKDRLALVLAIKNDHPAKEVQHG